MVSVSGSLVRTAIVPARCMITQLWKFWRVSHEVSWTSLTCSPRALQVVGWRSATSPIFPTTGTNGRQRIFSLIATLSMMWTSIFVSRWGRAQMPSAPHLRALAPSSTMTDVRFLAASEGDRRTRWIRRGHTGSIPGNVGIGLLREMATSTALDRQPALVRIRRRPYRVRALRPPHLREVAAAPPLPLAEIARALQLLLIRA